MKELLSGEEKGLKRKTLNQVNSTKLDLLHSSSQTILHTKKNLASKTSVKIEGRVGGMKAEKAHEEGRGWREGRIKHKGLNHRYIK